ncbi:hypothetical protein [Moheibacter stercoris]|uniref:Glycosyltransferase involved in cell wall biosynthesis n=1 Tax=Moheibacter stercoris TaxID=1628251 RepID=A0ABV2LSP6_9FLAO
MKVLLLQEMSGVHTELRNGLREIGIDADIATLGDGFKNYDTDIFLGNSNPNIIGAFNRVYHQFKTIKKILDFDIIQSISPSPYVSYLDNLIDDILTKNKKKIYIAAGSDPVYLNYVRNLDYFPPHVHFDRWNDHERFKQFEQFKQKLNNSYNRIIPVCWEYKYAMNMAGLKTEDIIPFPINTDKYVPTKRNNRKLRVFHPLNRNNLKYDFKGTLIIQKAFSILEKKFPNVEFIVKGNMNHKEYDHFTNDVDIIVDQCYSYSYGMSAAYGLSKGKVVLSGLEDIVKNDNIHYQECPIINITPSEEIIVDKIERFLEDENYLNDISIRSRSFAEKYHDKNIVAMKYEQIYKTL